MLLNTAAEIAIPKVTGIKKNVNPLGYFLILVCTNSPPEVPMKNEAHENMRALPRACLDLLMFLAGAVSAISSLICSKVNGAMIS